MEVYVVDTNSILIAKRYIVTKIKVKLCINKG